LTRPPDLPEPPSVPERPHGDPIHAIALTRPGAATARRLAEGLPGCRAWVPQRYAVPGAQGFQGPVADLVARLWPGARGFLLVMAAGIAVRAIANLLEDKTRDPAVVVLDPGGRFAVPILSGHLGGANDLARRAAQVLGGTPVLTTATDALGRPAVEVWAEARGFRWEPREGLVAANAALANGEPLGAWADPVAGGLPLLDGIRDHLDRATESEEEARGFPGVLLAVTPRQQPHLGAALYLRPPCLVAGVGCRRAADPVEVVAGVRTALARGGWSELSLAAVATVDAKAEEPALHRLSKELGLPLRVFPAEELESVRVPTPSERVRRAVGTPSVAEAAALAAAPGSRLVLPKVKGATWTLALAIRPPHVVDPAAT